MKAGFTLAEVLITLGIIGVVAAMTLPSVIANYQKQEVVSKVKKTYSILNQAMKRAEVDHEAYESWENASDIGPEEYFKKYWAPYMQVVKICTTYQDCGYDTLTPWSSTKGITNTLNVVKPDIRTSVYLSDGTLILISAFTGDRESIDDSIYVDINGPKKPNRAGKDFFVFTRTKNGIFPTGHDSSEDVIDRNCSKDGIGYYCAAKMMKDNWGMSANYPW